VLCILVVKNLSILVVQICILESFVTLKTAVKMLKIQLCITEVN